MELVCWNGFCIAGDCDGVNHVDATGDAWAQERGTEYCPAVNRYVPRDQSRSAGLITVLDDRDDKGVRSS